MLEIRSVEFSYGDQTRFTYDLDVRRGAATVIQGPSGVGKSTLLLLVAGFLSPVSGDIRWQDDSIVALPPSERPLSMLFQDNNLFDHLDAWTNIALGLDPRLKISDAEKHLVDLSMEQLGIHQLKDRLPPRLSGGQQQRVALARALVRAKGREKPLILLDEPFTALDPATRKDCLAAVRLLIDDVGMTALIVSHDPADAFDLDAEVFSLPWDGSPT
ncbi:ATP-binding cassette domain-containing protein [Alphaproteobacteria bacterium LSUCC0684]